jgi:hypothetical protein
VKVEHALDVAHHEFGGRKNQCKVGGDAKQDKREDVEEFKQGGLGGHKNSFDLRLVI